MPTQLVSAAITVPADFLWMHNIADAALPIGVMRLHNSNVEQWRDIELSAGNYSWTNLDTFITTQRTLGRKLSYVLYGTPFFYASAADQGFLDQYGHAGAAGYPAQDTNLNGLQAFITALITRYNSTSGVWRLANPTLGKGLAYVETWNEPDFSQTHTSYWWGTVSQMLDVNAAVYNSVKAVDSSVTVLGPSFDSATRFDQWLSGRGTLFNVSASDTCDAWNTHIYAVTSYGFNYAGIYKDPCFGLQGIYETRATAQYRGAASKPIYITEIGFNTDQNSKAFISLLAEQDASVRYKLMGRILLAAAAYGAKAVAQYNLGNLSGNFSTDIFGVRKAYTDVASAILGKTVISAEHFIGNQITIKCSDGSSITI